MWDNLLKVPNELLNISVHLLLDIVLAFKGYLT